MGSPTCSGAPSITLIIGVVEHRDPVVRPIDANAERNVQQNHVEDVGAAMGFILGPGLQR